MYEPIVDLWKRYRSRYAAWPADDPRHQLSNEIENRLGQLDLVLDLFRASMAVIEGDPEERRRERKWILENAQRLRAGEITGDQYEAGLRQFSPTREQSLRVVRAWEEVWLYTEMFYTVAWRVRQVLNGHGPRKFPNLGTIQAAGIRAVRNELIEHPERAAAPNYAQTLIVGSDGPILKGRPAWRVKDGRVEPLEEETDRGLHVNAVDFRRELEARLMKALV